MAVRAVDKPLGSLGYTYSKGALFIDPEHRGCGVGKLLMAHAQARSGGVVQVDVNEQNQGALGFYAAQGFQVAALSNFAHVARCTQLTCVTSPQILGFSELARMLLDDQRMDQPLWQNWLNIALIGFVARRAAVAVAVRRWPSPCSGKA